MAVRSVFITKDTYPYFEEVYVTMDWFGGFAKSQKRKCELSLHLNFNKSLDNKVLEISSSSLNPLGSQLSAMNLKKRTLRGVTSVESAFQSSRVYYDGDEKIGPHHEFLFLDGKECKKRVKELSRGIHSYEYEFDGMNFNAPDYHISLFYDYLYLNALLEEENKTVREILLNEGFTAFTDLATKALNSQARSCAIFVSLYKLGLIDKVKDYDSYLELFRVGNKDGHFISLDGAYKDVQLLRKSNAVSLLRPCINKTVSVEDVEVYYRKYYSHLTNKKFDDYKRLGVYDIDLSSMRFQKVYYENDLVALRVVGINGGIDIPVALLDSDFEFKVKDSISLQFYDDMYISETEYKNKVVYPSLNELNDDIMFKVKEQLS